ncbi:MAG: hypothetical protein FJY56_20225 [Betaproteobacteria bacterium]|nr:hypothetical protein [Betaproteobacteria bacterium]
MKAAVLSFAVYLIPVFGPHAVFVVGGLPIIHARTSPLWAASEIASLLVLQAALYVALRTRLWLGLVAAPLAVAGANLWFGALLPAWFLIEREHKPIIGKQSPACLAPNYRIEPVRAGASLELERAGVAWVAREGTPRYGLLDAQCAIKPIDGPNNFPQEIIEAIRPDGAVITRSANSAQPHGLLVEDGTIRLAQTIAQVGARTVKLDLPMPSSWTLLSYVDGEFLLARNEREVWTAREGTAAQRFAMLGFGLASTSFRRLHEGYVVWEGYTEDPRAKLQWELAGGKGKLEIARGRGIDSVSVNRDGTLIAVSVSNKLSVSARLDAVFVINTATGREVWRKADGLWRAEIAFVGSHRLAVTVTDGIAVYDLLP